MIYGYARVSSKEQSLKRQLKELEEQGIEKINIYKEFVSGKNFKDRVEYHKLLSQCRVGDTIIFTSLDRFSRSVTEATKEFENLEKRGITAKFLKENIDTGKEDVSKLIMSICLWIAEEERKTLKKRQRQGYEALQKTENGRMISKKGTLIGGREKKLTKNQIEMIKEFKEGKSIYNLSQLARLINVSRPYLYKKLKELESESM